MSWARRNDETAIDVAEWIEAHTFSSDTAGEIVESLRGTSLGELRTLNSDRAYFAGMAAQRTLDHQRRSQAARRGAATRFSVVDGGQSGGGGTATPTGGAAGPGGRRPVAPSGGSGSGPRRDGPRRPSRSRGPNRARRRWPRRHPVLTGLAGVLLVSGLADGGQGLAIAAVLLTLLGCYVAARILVAMVRPIKDATPLDALLAAWAGERWHRRRTRETVRPTHDAAGSVR